MQVFEYVKNWEINSLLIYINFKHIRSVLGIGYINEISWGYKANCTRDGDLFDSTNIYIWNDHLNVTVEQSALRETYS